MGPMQFPDGTVIEVFGSGGGQAVSTRLSNVLDQQVPLLGSIPLDPVLRADSEQGTPCIIQSPTSAAGSALDEVVARLAGTHRGLAGQKLPVTPRSLRHQTEGAANLAGPPRRPDELGLV